MSNQQIETRIRNLFYFLFGIIFTFLFILTSTYLEVLQVESDKQKEQIKKFLVEAVVVREKLFFEEFMTKNYNSISSRTNKLLTDLNIKNHELVIFDGANCMFGDEKSCSIVEQINTKERSNVVSSYEILGKVYISYPIHAWGEYLGMMTMIIPLNEIIYQKNIFDQLFFYIVPFLVLLLITFIIYGFTEKNIINPTLKRIIEAEKQEARRSLVKQFAHDIQSPILALEAVLENADDFTTESKELISAALGRITEISSDLLVEERLCTFQREDHGSSLIKSLVDDKKLEYKDKFIEFEEFYNEEFSNITIYGHGLYRVLSNLINNSIESSGNKKLRINISAIVDKQEVKFSIRDNGVGISEEMIPLILQGGFTSKVHGNGLGVSGAKRWVEKNNGLLEINSSLGVGTEVNFILPFDNKEIFKLC
jgi:signal transduction histidine kinase